MATSGEYGFVIFCHLLLSRWFFSLISGFDDTTVDLQLIKIDL